MVRKSSGRGIYRHEKISRACPSSKTQKITHAENN